MSIPRIMIVDDEQVIARDIKSSLESLGFKATSIVSTGIQAIEKAKQDKPDMVLMDIHLRDQMDGIEAANSIYSELHIPVVYLTAYADEELLARARASGSFGYLVKPFDELELKATIDMALNKAEMETKIRESEEKYHTIFDISMEGISIVDLEGNVLMANRRVAQLLGFKSAEEYIGQSGFKYVAPEEKERLEGEFQRILKTGSAENLEFLMVRKDGTKFPAEFTATLMKIGSGETTKIMSVMRDISDRKQAEEERREIEKHLFQAQKFESLNTLAGSIAHHFNNILMAVIGNLDLAKMNINSTHELTENIEAAKQSAQRAAEISTLMLTYVGQRIGEKKIIDMNRITEDIIKTVEYLTNQNTIIEINPSPRGVYFNGDPTQIRQVFINLIKNAVEALPDKSGSITISIGQQFCESDQFRQPFLDTEMDSGHYVTLEVKDDGIGMDQVTLSKIFEPFYTTKFTGRGLGLAAVLGIVRSHKGAITFDSKKAKGTTVKVFFPAVEKPETETGSPGSTQQDTEWQGSGTIMIVDDEDIVLRACKRMLEFIGFDVLTATNGSTAIDLFQKKAGEIRCIILDMTMPDMDGYETYVQLQKIDDSIPVIFTSGFPKELSVDVSTQYSATDFLKKPYDINQLAKKIKTILKE